VARRLAQLSAELAGSRPVDAAPGGEQEADDWAPVAQAPSAPPATEPPATEPPAAEPELAPVVPVPGRHASRRAGRLLAAAVPETLRGRVALGPPQVTVLALLIALGLAVTCWWVLRGSASEIVAPAGVTPAAATASSAPLATAAPSGSLGTAGATGAEDPAATGSVTVDVAGKVRRPGIAVLDPGSRVVDALRRPAARATGWTCPG
jgi:competence protein ComEA